MKKPSKSGRTGATAKHGAIKTRPEGIVRADGAVSLGDIVGSIHRIGALAQGLEACNGWAYWHIEDKKGRKSIDDLRAIMRGEMAAAGV